MKKLLKRVIALCIIMSVLIINCGAYQFSVIQIGDWIFGNYTDFDVSGGAAYLVKPTVGVVVADVNDLEKIRVVTTIDMPEIAEDAYVVASKNFLYISSKSGLAIYNVSDKKNPLLVSKLNETNNAMMRIHNDLLYAFDTSGISVYDISNPRKMAKKYNISDMGKQMAGYVDDNYIYAVNSSMELNILANKGTARAEGIKKLSLGSGLCYDICKSGDYLYIGDRNGKKIYVTDVSDVANAKVVCSLDAGSPVRRMSVYGNSLYAASYNDRTLMKFDISNPTAPVKIYNFYCTRSSSYANSVKAIDDRYCFMAGGSSFAVLDHNYSVEEPDMTDVAAGVDQKKIEDMPNPFTDVSEDNAKSISRLYAANIITDNSEHKFYPNRNITRAEFMTMAVKYLKLPIEKYKEIFKDVSETDWHRDIMQTAEKYNLIADNMNDNGYVKPNTDITREEAAEVINRILKYSGNAFSNESDIAASDAEAISTWAKEAVGNILSKGIMKTDGEGKFNPAKFITKAEAAEYIAATMKASEEKAEYEFLDNTETDVSANKKVTFTEFAKTAERVDDGRPFILKVGDAVEPGEIFNIYGEYFGGEVKIYLEKSDSPDMNPEPGENAIECEIKNINESKQCITAIMPENTVPGTYVLWVKNSVGTSYPARLNAARSNWIDTNEASWGNVIRIVGRNLDAREFKGEPATGVVLVKDGKVYDLDVVSLNPYCIKASIPEGIPSGEYKMAVTNDGIVWNENEEDKTITIIGEKVNDPFGLGVSWANRFNYDNKIDVTKEPYSITPDGTTDVTTIIQKAIDDVKALGGGIVYLPAGKYKFSSLEIPAGIILSGAGMTQTILIHKPNSQSEIAIKSKDDACSEGLQGIARLQIKLDGSVTQDEMPDTIMWLGDINWGANVDNALLRTAKYVFIKETKMDYPMSFDAATKDKLNKNISIGKRTGLIMIMQEHFLFADNVWTGTLMHLQAAICQYYAKIENSTFIADKGPTSVYGSKSVTEGNYMKFIGGYYNRKYSNSNYSVHALFIKDHCYVSRNYIYGTGDPNATDGEVICGETYRGGMKMQGSVVSSTEDEVVVAPVANKKGELSATNGGGHERPWEGYDETNFNDGWYMYIQEGKGMGQLKRVLQGDEYSRTVKLAEPWDIIPDSTSKFRICCPLNVKTIYNNYAEQCKETIIIYGDGYDDVIAKNNMVDTGGVAITCFYNSDHGGSLPSEFIRIENNKIKGYGKRDMVGGIKIVVPCETEKEWPVVVYGVEIKNNELIGGGYGDVVRQHQMYVPDCAIHFESEIKRVPAKAKSTIRSILVSENTIKEWGTGLYVGEQWRSSSLYHLNYSLYSDIFSYKNTIEDCKTAVSDVYNAIKNLD